MSPSTSIFKRGADDPTIFAPANPTAETTPEIARKASPVALIATGRSDDLNQVNNVLCFSFIFRGALDAEATEINEAMTLTCAKAIAALAWKPATSEVRQVYRGEALIFGRDHPGSCRGLHMLWPKLQSKAASGPESRIQRTTETNCANRPPEPGRTIRRYDCEKIWTRSTTLLRPLERSRLP